jgi:acetolactate synthase-1/2/3 large subunit
MDHVSLMRPITKWADACYQTERIPETIATAVRHAVSGIPGPAFLEIPLDILMGQVEWEDAPIPPIRTLPPGLSPPACEVLAALRILEAAERPMLIAGTSVKWSNAQAALNAFLDRTCLPAYANGMGRGTIPRVSPHLFNRTRRQAMEDCDALVLAGSVLDFRLAFGATIPKDSKIIQMEMDNTLIGHNRSADVGLVGSLACSFKAMVDLMDEHGIRLDFSRYAAQLRTSEGAEETEQRARRVSDEVPIDPMRLCKEIADFVDDDMIVIGDGGDIVAQAAKVVPIPINGAWMDPGPLGTLGVGMPFAIASQLACPEKRVLIIYGDGSFGFNGFEYDTAVRFDLPIVGIVGNDAAWGQMMRPQAALYGADRLVATRLNATRYDRIVEAMGGYGEQVERPDQIRPALERAFRSRRPACINVVIKQDLEYKGGSYI